MKDNILVCDLDIYSDEVIRDPYPVYKELPDMGPAVWMSSHDFWVLPRYREVLSALKNPKVFSSAHGCMLNKPTNDATKGIMLCTDDPEHQELRRIYAEPLLPASVAELKPRFEELVEPLIKELLQRDEFDVVKDLAYFLPVTVVTELIGLPEDGRDRMVEWAAQIFNSFGPLPNKRTELGMEVTQKVLEYLHNDDTIQRLKPGGLGARLFNYADEGKISRFSAESMLFDYLTPSLDTTISATASLIWLLGENPEQWELLREDPSLIPGAINEAIRLQTPLRAFSRYVTEEHSFDELTLPAGARVSILWASANRDERRWVEPEKFDIRRDNVEHMAFGYGSHMCPGMHLARLEISAIMEAMIKQVKEIEIGEPEHIIHNTIVALERLFVSFH